MANALCFAVFCHDKLESRFWATSHPCCVRTLRRLRRLLCFGAYIHDHKSASEERYLHLPCCLAGSLIASRIHLVRLTMTDIPPSISQCPIQFLECMCNVRIMVTVNCHLRVVHAIHTPVWLMMRVPFPHAASTCFADPKPNHNFVHLWPLSLR